MTLWQDILKTAIVGTERNALALSARGDALGDVLSKLDTKAREASLLSAAAAVALYERAGQLPNKDMQALPAPSEADDAPCCNARAAQHLSLMLSGEYREVLPEWLTTLAQAQQRIPEELLPQIMDAGFRETGVRESVIRVIGKRGVWLARQNPEWKYAIGKIDEATWDTDSHAARLALIKTLRAQNPAAATQRLRASWQENSPKERAEFLELLLANLSHADEEFLEFALDDRSTIVRQAAAGLLRNLPESAFVKRMMERVQPLVSFTPKPRNKFTVEITLPAERTEDMIRDGITAKSSSSAVGEKAWWLTLMIEAVPFAFWLQHSGLTQDQLIQAVSKSEWREMFLDAWLQNGFRLGDITLLTEILAIRPIDHLATSFAQKISPARLDDLLIKLFDLSEDEQLQKTLNWLLLSHQLQWSEPLSRSILRHWDNFLFQFLKHHAYQLNRIAISLNARILPEILDKLSHLDSQQADKKRLELYAMLQFRIDMLKEITQ